MARPAKTRKRDTRSHRTLRFRKGDVLKYRGLKIEITNGTGNVEALVLTPRQHPHVFVAIDGDKEH